MAERSRIRGFTHWVNLRLKSHESSESISSVLTQLMQGEHLRHLIETITGAEFRKLTGSFTGLSIAQKEMRMNWILAELKERKVFGPNLKLDMKQLAVPSPKHVFDLLWRLVSLDIIFLWNRYEYLMTKDFEALTKYPLKWVPDRPASKKKKKFKETENLMGGFGASSVTREEVVEDDPEGAVLQQQYTKFPGTKEMFAYKRNKVEHTPPASDAILDIISQVLIKSKSGYEDGVDDLEELADVRALCAFANYFFPQMFCAEIFLNDRWALNLILRTLETIFEVEASPFDSEDLRASDKLAVSTYFCTFLLLCFQYRQGAAAVARWKSLDGKLRQIQVDFAVTPDDTVVGRETRDNLKKSIAATEDELKGLHASYDLGALQHTQRRITKIKLGVSRTILDAMEKKFCVVTVPRAVSVSRLCVAMDMNLYLTQGNCFTRLLTKESVARRTRIIVHCPEGGTFLDNFTDLDSNTCNDFLTIPVDNNIELHASSFPHHEIYIECQSKHRNLAAGSQVCYQIFPADKKFYEMQLLAAASNGQLGSVENIVSFFEGSCPNFINCKHPKSGNTPLHLAAIANEWRVCLYLLEHYANINAVNKWIQTPFFVALESQSKDAGRLLCEWGCDTMKISARGASAMDSCKNQDTVGLIVDWRDYYQSIVSPLVAGDVVVLRSVLAAHKSKTRPLLSLRSRCVSGSTLLHTAVFWQARPLVDDLLEQLGDADVRDYKGASALHCVKTLADCEMLLHAGATVDARDNEGNTPLHLAAFGDVGQANKTEIIGTLLKAGADPLLRNKRQLLPVHCASMQGRTSIIQQLLTAEPMIFDKIAAEAISVPSLPYLALAYDYIQCSEWLVSKELYFKPGETDELLKRLLADQVEWTSVPRSLNFILQQGASANPTYVQGNSALHYAALRTDRVDILETLLTHGAEVNVTNEDGNTPLHFACQRNNFFTASALISGGASYELYNHHSLSPFDLVPDLEEWSTSGLFTEEVSRVLQAHLLRQAKLLIDKIHRDVVRGLNPGGNSLPQLQPASASRSFQRQITA